VSAWHGSFKHGLGISEVKESLIVVKLLILGHKECTLLGRYLYTYFVSVRFQN